MMAEVYHKKGSFMCFFKEIARFAILIFISFTLVACKTSTLVNDGPPLDPVDHSVTVNATPTYLPKSRYGNPPSYVINGVRYYVLDSAQGYKKRGIASWYGKKFHKRLTSSREPYDMYAMTAASPNLPIPCYVRVTNLENGREVIVKVNDRGPFARNRIIDLSYAAAKKLGYMKQGTTMVEVTAIDTQPLYAQTQPTQPIKKARLYLQIGAFSQHHNALNAQRKAQQITSKPVEIITARHGLQFIYRVQVGPLTGVGDSDKTQALFARSGFTQAMTVIH